MPRLLRRAYKRLKAENPGGKLQWDEAISTLKNGDHYVLVLSNIDGHPISVPATDLLIVSRGLLRRGLVAAEGKPDQTIETKEGASDDCH